MVRGIIVGLAVLGLLTGCGDEYDTPDLKTGKQLFDYHCAECHQQTGEGAFLRGVPPVRYTGLTYRELVKLIQGHDRHEGSRMESFEGMPKAQAEKIAIYVRRKLKAKDSPK